MWNNALVRELAIILVLKLAALYVLWLAFFNQGGKPDLTDHEVGSFLLGEPREASGPSSRFIHDKGVRDGY